MTALFFPLFAKLRALLTPAERGGALVLLSFMVLGMALETLCTGLVVPVVALMTQPQLVAAYGPTRPIFERFGSLTQTEMILGAMLGLVVVYALKNVYLAYLAWRQAGFAYTVQASVSERLLRNYLRQPYTFHLRRNSAQLIHNATREVALFSESMVNGLNVVSELLVLAGISTLLLLIEPVGALVAVAVLGAAGWAVHRALRHRLVRWGERRQFHDGMRMQHLQQGLGAAKDVKLLGREGEFLSRYADDNGKSARIGQRQVTAQQLPRLWLELLAVIGLCILVAAMLAQGKTVASIAPTVGLFAAAAFRLMPSANRVLTALQTLRYCVPSINVLYDEFRLVGEPQTAANAEVPLNGEIRFVDVGYTYEGASTPALSELDIRIGKGECVGFVGSSGAGKSTLVDVLLGLLKPTTGRVTVGGQDIQTALRAWQSQIGYVPQAIFLTDDSVRRNIAFGVPDGAIDEASVWRAVKAAQLDAFVAGLPDGLDTLVGERGVRLSGGQRQRIGIARALYHDPAVLVLDEATSALDTATEGGVMQAVAALQGQKTIAIVAHRLSTVARCDRLYQLERGRIVAQGHPSDLLPIPRLSEHVQQ